MASVLAVVSRKVFEASTKGLDVLDLWPVNRYLSKARGLRPLSGGGSLYLVTVRPGERIWLVGVLRGPAFTETRWVADANSVPITDISSLRSTLRFTSGKGVSQRTGALAMSLQTPRSLTDGDVALLEAVISHHDSQSNAPTVPPAPRELAEAATPGTGLEVLTLARWSRLDLDERRQLAVRAASLVTGFSVEDDGMLREASTGVRFALVPGGVFSMGLSAEEETRLRAGVAIEPDEQEMFNDVMSEGLWHPAHDVNVAPFLIALEPLDNEILAVVLDRDDALSEDCCFGPAHLSRAAQGLEKLGWRLPTEAEWEHACRAGTRGLFPGGSDAIPNAPDWPANAFGLAMLGQLPEVCADGWHTNYEGAPSDARVWAGKGHVLRGGAAMMFPWQGCCEWTTGLCAARGNLAWQEFFVALRPAVSLFDDAVAYAPECMAQRAKAGIVYLEPPDPAVASEATDPDVTPDLMPDAAPDATGTAPNPSLVIRTMYEKVAVDLNRLASMTEKEALNYLKKGGKKALERGFWSGDDAFLAAALPDFLQRTDIPARHEVGRLVVDRFFGGAHVDYLPFMDWRTLGYAQLDDCMLALLERRQSLLTLLGDPDPKVRALMPLVLAPPLQGATGLALLAKRIQNEPDPAVRASLAIGAGVAGSVIERVPDGEWLGVLREQLTDSDLTSQLAAAVALITLTGARFNDEPLKICSRAFTEPPKSPGFIPWANGDIHEWIVRVLGGAASEPGQTLLDRILLDRIAQLLPSANRTERRAASRCANLLLERHFAWNTQGTLAVESLTSMQSQLLVALSGEGGPDARFDERGIPLELGERRRWLGL